METQKPKAPAPAGQQKKKGGKKSAGSRKGKIQHYYLNTYPRHKLRRILDSQGKAAAEKWAKDHMCTGFLIEILRGRKEE